MASAEADADYIIVGSGINALVAGAMLGKRGHKVAIVEREGQAGGCLRTEEATAPGFLHDVLATTFVLFVTSPAFALLAPDLARHGLEFANSDAPTGVLLPDGRSLILGRDRAENVRRLGMADAADGDAFAAEMSKFEGDAGFVFGLLGGQLWSRKMLALLVRQVWQRGLHGLAAFFGDALIPARAYLETHYRSELTRALFAPWVLHLGLGPESVYSGEMLKVIAFALEAAGAPVAIGGAQKAVAAFEALIVEQGGTIQCNADVEQIVMAADGGARGVRLKDGRRIGARKGVICSVTPQQLVGRLLAGQTVPSNITTGVENFRYGKGNMQIHYALSEPPRWRDPALAKVALLHLTPGLDGVSRATNEAERGLLPAVPTICVGQPVTMDASRAPPGQSILWLQLPEMPRTIKGDAAGELRAEHGQWTDALRESYADRVAAILASHIENFPDCVLKRRCYSPADLEAMNMNLVGGDPYGGATSLDQFFLWRPFKTSVNHGTHIKRLYQIGASTHPGPGLGGGSGFLLANALR